MKPKRKFTRFLLGALLTGVTVCGAASAVYAYPEVSAELREAEAVEETYILNDVFTAPDTKIVYEGKEYDAAKKILVYPDGNAYEGGGHALNREGEYTIKYVAQAGGKTLVAEKRFSVVPSFYSFESTGGSATALENASCEYVDGFEMAPQDETDGLRVSIPADTTFKVNQVIDLNAIGTQPLITIYPYNDTFLLGRDGKTVEAHDIVVTLTDCNDPDNYIELEYHWTTRQQTNYFAPVLYYKAGSCGSERTAFDTSSAGSANSFEYNGKYYVKRRTGFGTYSLYDRSDVYGTKKEDGTVTATKPGDKSQLSIHDEYVKSCGFSFYFDNATNEVRSGEILGGTSVQTPRLVSNLSQAEVYGAKSFKGFLTGKVYLSVHAEQYNVNNAYAGIVPAVNMEISNICGMTGTQLNRGENTAKDTTKPYIVIDGVENDEQILYTQTGSEVLLPEAKVYDTNLKDSTVSVFFNYGRTNQTSVDCANGKFTAEKVGEYTVLYKATDTFGNTRTVALHVISRKGNGNNPLEFSVEKVTSAQAGKELSIPAATTVSKNTGAFSKAYYSYNGEEYLPVEDGKFFVEHVGEYSVKYVYGDMIHRYEYGYTFEAAASDAVMFGESYFPYYLIKGAKYTLDDMYAYVYTEADPKAVLSEIYVSEDGKAFVKIDASSYEVNAEKSVAFKYVRNGKETITESIPVVDVGFNGELEKGAYFQGEGFTRESDYEGTLYKNDGGKNELRFINVVSLSNFSFEYIIPEGYTNFRYLDFTLTDYYDRDNSFTVRVERDLSRNGAVMFSVGNNRSFLTPMFVNTVLLFKYRSGKIFYGSNFVRTDKEFTTDKALFRIELLGEFADGGDEKSGIKIRQVGNSVLDEYHYDAMPSLMSFAESLPFSVKKGETVTLKAVNLFDTFSPFLKSGLVLYATAPDGTNIRAVEGVVLERGCNPLQTYTFSIEQNGVYWVYYEYTDQKGNTTTISASMSIKDEEPPKIELSGGYTSKTVVTAKLNSKYTLQGYTVSDNKTKSDKLSVSVLILKPSGEIYVEEGESITPDCAGDWRVIYYCVDGDGNASTEYYTLRVVK